MPEPRIPVPHEAIADFCRRWKISRLALFGSVIRDDFRPESDVDVLVRFQEDENWSLWDLGEMALELEDMFGREVDLVEFDAIRNPYRRKHIIENHQVIYAA